MRIHARKVRSLARVNRGSVRCRHAGPRGACVDPRHHGTEVSGTGGRHTLMHVRTSVSCTTSNRRPRIPRCMPRRCSTAQVRGRPHRRRRTRRLRRGGARGRRRDAAPARPPRHGGGAQGPRGRGSQGSRPVGGALRPHRLSARSPPAPPTGYLAVVGVVTGSIGLGGSCPVTQPMWTRHARSFLFHTCHWWHHRSHGVHARRHHACPQGCPPAVHNNVGRFAPSVHTLCTGVRGRVLARLGGGRWTP